jgi:hypothetical protein
MILAGPKETGRNGAPLVDGIVIGFHERDQHVAGVEIVDKCGGRAAKAAVKMKGKGS